MTQEIILTVGDGLVMACFIGWGIYKMVQLVKARSQREYDRMVEGTTLDPKNPLYKEK